MKNNFTLGAVAYAPKVITIWEGFKEYFQKHDLQFDYVLYSNYETQVESLVDGQIDVAWNSPLAWLRAERMGKSKGTPVSFGPMRDSDQDLTSVLIIKKNSGIQKVTDLIGKKIGFGAIDSPQARLIPLDHLRQSSLIANKDYQAKNFDVLGGKHGDHIGGERDAALALINNEIDAAWLIDSNYQAFSQEGTLTSGETLILTRTEKYDHCIFTFSPEVTKNPNKIKNANQFNDLLFSMKWSDPNIRLLLELEGLKEWKPGRTSGFSILNRAIDSERFYGQDGKIIEPNYKY